MVEITFPIVLQIVQTVSIAVGIIYYLFNMRDAQKTRELTLKAQEQAKDTRQVQILMQLYETYRSPEFRIMMEEIINQEWTDYDDFWEKYGAINNPVAWANWGSVAAFFNGVGVLLKKGCVDITLVEELLSNIAFVLWFRMEPVLKGWRKVVEGNRFGKRARSSKFEDYSGFEYLVNEFNKREQEYIELNT